MPDEGIKEPRRSLTGTAGFFYPGSDVVHDGVSLVALFLTGVLKQDDTIFSDKMDDPMEQARAMRKAEEEAAAKGGN